MTKVIIIQGGSLDSYYDMTMDYLLAKYHTHPSTPTANKNRENERYSDHYGKSACNADADAFFDYSPPSLN